MNRNKNTTNNRRALSSCRRRAERLTEASKSNGSADISTEIHWIGGGGIPKPNTRDARVSTAQCADTLVLHFHIDCLSIIFILILQESLADLINIDGGRNGVPRDLGGECVLICDGGGRGV